MKIDVAIIGAGPAGLSAGIFTCRAGLTTICFEALAVGGQASLSYNIENYPGFNSIAGIDLSLKILEHAESVGLELNYSMVTSVKQKSKGFEIKTKNETFTADKVIVATGCKARKLNLDNEDRLTGKGVSYCASCDGNFFKEKSVAVVGGGDTAFENVEYLSRICKSVTLINRSERFRGHPKTFEEIKKLRNVKILTNAQVVAIHGDEVLEGITISQNGSNKREKVDGLFIAIGHMPDLSFLQVDVDKDSNGYIVVDDKQQTNVNGLLACGDIVSKDFKQVITACADGARAGNSCIRR